MLRQRRVEGSEYDAALGKNNFYSTSRHLPMHQQKVRTMNDNTRHYKGCLEYKGYKTCRPATHRCYLCKVECIHYKSDIETRLVIPCILLYKLTYISLMHSNGRLYNVHQDLDSILVLAMYYIQIVHSNGHQYEERVQGLRASRDQRHGV